MKVFVAVLIALVATQVVDARTKDMFSAFKQKFGKVYKDAEEELHRMKIFFDNWAQIQEHNIRYYEGKETYYLDINEFADMTNVEFARQYNGYRRTTNAPLAKPESTFSVPENFEVPASVDWRTKGYVTGVKNQGQCGSCWAFSTTGSLEGQHFKKTGKLVSLSEQNLVDCSSAEGNQGCNGGLMDQAFTYIKKNGGIDSEKSYPYTAENGKCKYSANNEAATDNGFVDIPSKNETALTAAIASVGPISVAIDASQLGFQFYRGGVYYGYLCSQTSLDHGVLAVGYGTESGKDYYIVKNSWGETWGQNGYILMSRNRNNNCGIATQASYPTV